MDASAGRDSFERALARDQVLVLDGGLATQLESSGHDLNNNLWSAAVLQSDPQAIIDAHRAYFDVGAECIISASYQASRQGYRSRGLSSNDADRLIVSSVELALAAKQQFLASRDCPPGLPLVAASVGPYGAAQHDGSEYTGNYGISNEELLLFHQYRLALLDSAGADVLACETIPSLQEAEVLGSLLRDAQTPAWVSFSCRDERHISDGTPLREAVAIFADNPRVLAVGINCTPPQYVTSLIAHAKAGAPDKTVIAYPNSGEIYSAATNTWSGTVSPLDCGLAARQWRQAGARIIGGCCRMGPAHIAAMRECLT